MMLEKIEEQRNWLRSGFIDDEEHDVKSDQELGLPQPPLQKPYDETAEIIALPKVDESVLKKINIMDIFRDRKSNRVYTDESITLKELSFLLWATQGVKDIKGNNYCTLRPVPSAGARHPFETYIAVNRVEGLKKGVYRYLALSHELLFIKEDADMEANITAHTLGQKFAGKSAVTFIWSVVPYRGEWRYSIVAHKPMLLDSGHVCQNLYLACEAVGCGTCAIAAYDQKGFDNYLELDGEEEFVVYVAPVGRV